MKKEFESNQKQKILAVNDLDSYIKNTINEELNSRNISSNSITPVKDENLEVTHDNSKNNHLKEIHNEMNELKKNQKELIENVNILFNVKDEIYNDFETIKSILTLYKNQILELENKINKGARDNGNNSNNTNKQGEITGELSAVTENVQDKVKELSSVTNSVQDKVNDLHNTLHGINDRLQLFEKLELQTKVDAIKKDINTLKNKNGIITSTCKNAHKQLEEKLYEKIRVRQNEVTEGFANQDKKLEAMDGYFKQKIKELEDKSHKCNDQCTALNKKIKEVHETVDKLSVSNSEELIKQLSEEIKENKIREGKRITDATNVLNEKINKVDTKVEYLEKQNDDIRKESKTLENNVKIMQEKYKDIEGSIRDVSNIALNVNDTGETLKKKYESIQLAISIIETSVNSLETQMSNYDMDQIKNNSKVARDEMSSFLQKQYPNFIKENDKKFDELDKKFLAKIGDVYKSINGYTQKLDVHKNKVDEKIKLLETNYRKDLNECEENFNQYLRKLNDTMNDTMGNVVQDLKKTVRKEVKKVKLESGKDSKELKNDQSVASTSDINTPPNLDQYMDEVQQLKQLIVTSNTKLLSSNDPNYQTLQSFLSDILRDHWKKFEKSWKTEFYRCVDEINKMYMNKKPRKEKTPMVIDLI